MKKRSKTALVFNPSRSLSIGGAKRNPARKRRSARRRHRRSNPVLKRVVARRANPVRRRRRNPATTTGLLVAAIMAGIGVSVFDVVATRIVPANSSLVRAGVKLGGAWLFQSSLGSKVPILGKYRNDIALVLAVSGVVDLMKLYIFPLVAGAAGSIGLLGGQAPLFEVGQGDGTTGDIYGNAVPAYGYYS